MLKMEQMDQIGSEELGNTKPVPKRSKLSKRWTVTFFGSEKREIKKIFEPHTDVGIIGNEVCPNTKKTHLQCYFEFKKRLRPLDKKDWKSLKGHWEVAKGDKLQNFVYCSKEDLYYNSWGYVMPISDEEFKFTDKDLNADQLRIADIFRSKEDPKFGRKIYWFYEEKGGWGKSVLATYMVDQMDAIMVGGQKKDILFGVGERVKMMEYPPIVVVDIPRVNKGSVSIQAIEMVKNGMFFNEKYESGMVRFPRPHVVCFANIPPDTSKMSEDRWVIENLRPDYVSPISDLDLLIESDDSES